MQSQQCTTADGLAALKIRTLIAGTPRCCRGARQLSGGTQDCARRFHVMQKATTVTEKVRRGEHRPRMTDNYDSLNKTKYVRLTSFKNLTEKRRRLFDTTYARQLQTEKAWHPKKGRRFLWPEHRCLNDHFSNDWYRTVIHTKLEPMTAAENPSGRVSEML